MTNSFKDCSGNEFLTPPNTWSLIHNTLRNKGSRTNREQSWPSRN